jgi:addiction module HigA family antidote
MAFLPCNTSGHAGPHRAVRLDWPLELSKNQLAMNIRVPATRIGEIVRGKRAITPDTALRRLARFFGNSLEFWLNLQQLHDLTEAKLNLGSSERTSFATAVGQAPASL